MKIRNKIVSLLLSLILVSGTLPTGSVCFASYAPDDSTVYGSASPVISSDNLEDPAPAEPTVKVLNTENEVTIGYKETRYYEFEAANLPAKAAVHVFLNGEDRDTSTIIYVTKPTEDYTVEARIIDADGSVIAVSGEIRVTVKNGFFDRLAAAVRDSARTAGDAVMDILGAIFMRVWIFLHR